MKQHLSRRLELNILWLFGQGLINFLMMRGPGQVNAVDNIIADAVSSGSEASQGLGTKDRKDMSILYL